MKKFSAFYTTSLLFSFALSNTATAGCSQTACTDFVTMTYVTNGRVLVQTASDETLLNCTPVSGKFLTLEKSSDYFDEAYSMILAADMNKKKLRFRIAEGSSNCRIRYVTTGY